jgi:hypothetical protein
MVWNYGFMYMKNNQAAIKAYKKSEFHFFQIQDHDPKIAGTNQSE